MKNIFLIIMCAVSIACSFKGPDKDGLKTVQNISGVEVTPLDTDGDGVSDNDEIKNGTDPLVAEMFNFDGEFFQDLKLKVNFYKRSDNTNYSTTFYVSKSFVSEGGIKTEDRDFVSNGSEFLAEDSARQANKVSYFGSHLKSSIDQSYLNLFSPPRLNDKRVLPFSKNVKELLSFSDYDSIEFTISNNINFSDITENSYTDLIVDLVWYDDLEKRLYTIGSDFVKGTFLFNRSYNDVPFNFKLNNKEITKRIVENGARNIFLKVRDFRVVETGVFYKQKLQAILERSIPLVISNGEKVRTVYVGLGGGNRNLKDILSSGLKERFLISNSRLLSVGDLTEKTEVTGELFGTPQVSTSRWFVVTNEIHNNPFNYSFGVNDIIVLSYNRNLSDSNLVPSYYSMSLSDSNSVEPKTLFIQKSNFPYFRIGLKTESFDGFIQSGKGSDSCQDLASYCWEMFASPVSTKGQSAKEAIALVDIVINNKRFNLYDLFLLKKIKLVPRNSEITDVTFDPSILVNVNSGTNLTITIKKSLISSRNYCTGKILCAAGYFECSQLNSENNQCLESGEFDRYTIINKTTTFQKPFKASLLMSIESI